MDRRKIVRYLSERVKYTSEQKQLIDAIEDAKEQLNRARQYFEVVTDPQLIDYAIYMEQAAKSRYAYLLSLARERGITIDNSFYSNEVSVG